MNRGIGIVSSLVLFSLGCSEPTIDATSDETAKASMERIHTSLSEEEKKKFQEALPVILFQDLESLENLFSAAQDADSFKADALKKLHGKTAEEVIADAERIVAERREKEREQALQEIKELEEKKQKAEAAKAYLGKFEVLKSRFYKRTRSFGTAEPIIELRVRNGTEHAISRAYFSGTLATPGRAVPWLREDFNYQVPGGVEPGETADWSLAPNMFSEWGSVEQRDDMVLTVEVMKLDGPDGETLYDSNFSEEDDKRLQALKEKYSVQ